MLFLLSADFYLNYVFKKFFLKHYQSVKQFRSILSVLIWVQTVCKGYQQVTKVATCKERVKRPNLSEVILLIDLKMTAAPNNMITDTKISDNFSIGTLDRWQSKTLILSTNIDRKNYKQSL